MQRHSHQPWVHGSPDELEVGKVGDFMCRHFSCRHFSRADAAFHTLSRGLFSAVRHLTRALTMLCL
jgi:hypothetical protein